MASGFAPIASWVISWDNLKTIIPSETQALDEILAKGGATIEDFCRQYGGGDDTWLSDGYAQHMRSDEGCDRWLKAVNRAWNATRKAFYKAAMTGRAGLKITAGYQGPNDGGIYDHPIVQRPHFYVDGVEAETPAGKRFRRQLIHALWTTYG
jgi:hypothetical protein